MAALPSIVNFERDLVDAVKGTLDSAMDKMNDQFRALGDSITGKTRDVLDQIAAPFVSIVDSIKINAVGRAMDRIKDKVGSVFGSMLKDPGKAKIDILTETTEDGFAKTVEALNRIDDHLQRSEEEQKQDDERFKPEPGPWSPESDPIEEKKGLGSFLSTFFGTLSANMMKLLPVALKGVAIAGILTAALQGVVSATGDWAAGAIEAQGEGRNEIAGGIKALLVGVENDIMSRLNAIGRWAAVGAAFGLPGGIPGIMAGGIIGAGLGLIAQTIDYFFGDFLERALDGIVDGSQQFMEIFTGGNIDRIQDRIDDMKNRETSILEEAERNLGVLEKLRSELRAAEEAGNDATAKKLRGEIHSAEKVYNSTLAKLDENTERMRGFEEEIAVANGSTWDRFKLAFTRFDDMVTSWVHTAADYLVPDFVEDWSRRKIEGIREWVNSTYEGILSWMGEKWDGIVSAVVGFWDNTIVAPVVALYERIKSFSATAYETVSTKISDTWDTMVTFFTDTIPETISDLINGIREKLEQSFEYVKELGKTAYDELSLTDFNPFSDGPSYSERIMTKMKSFEDSSRIRENSERQNSNAEAAFTATNESMEALLARPSNMTANAVKNTKVENNSFYEAGLSVRDKDPASVRDLIGVNGMAINP